MSEMRLATFSADLAHILVNKILLEKIQKEGMEDKGKKGAERGEGRSTASCP